MANGVQTSIGEITQSDIDEFMKGSNHPAAGLQSYGSQPTQGQWGLTSQPLGIGDGPPQDLGSPAEIDLRAQAAIQAAINPQAPAGGELMDQLREFQKRYGDSENEKGEIRRALQEQLDANRQLMEQMQLMFQANQTNQFHGAAQSWGPPMNYPNPQPRDPFEGRQDGEFLEIGQAKQLFSESILPLFRAQEAEFMRALDAKEASGKRMAAGITPFDEMRLTQRNPWVQAIPSESARVDAILSLKKQESAAQLAAPALRPQFAPAPQASPQTANLAQRITHTEATQATTAEPLQDAIQAAYLRDYTDAMAKPEHTGERAKALRAIATKYNLPIGTGHGAMSRAQIII